jgi:hypothetical protein
MKGGVTMKFIQIERTIKENYYYFMSMVAKY